MAHALVLVVNDQRPTTQRITTIAHLALPRPDLLRRHRLLDVGVRPNRLQRLDRLRRLGQRLNAGNDDRDLGHLHDTVTAGHHQRRDGAGRQRRRHRVPALLRVDLAVPAAIGLGRSEHATFAAHVAERALACTVRTAAGDTWDAGDGTTRAPGLGAVLMAGLARDGVRLAMVLGHGRVHEVDEVGADRGQ